MSRYAVQQACSLCLAAATRSPFPASTSVVTIEQTGRFFSSSRQSLRREKVSPSTSSRNTKSKGKGVGGASAPARYAGGRFSRGSAGSHGNDTASRSTFKFSSDLPLLEVGQTQQDNAAKVLNIRTRELASDSGSKLMTVLESMADCFGLDRAEIVRLATQWASTRPFQRQSDAKGKGREVEGHANLPDLSTILSNLPQDLKLFGPRALDRIVLSSFMSWLSARSDISDQLRIFSETLDLRHPGEWYAGARARKRKLIMHVGPTNSGKTYNALCALAKARTGAFAGPLRLLAVEVFNRFNSGSIGGLTPDKPRPCNLVTGEEQRIVDPLAGLESCTVEMMSVSKHFDTVVIDEIQMMGDPQRGPAWTAALLGINAREIHLCGEPSVVDLVTRIGHALGDEVIVNRYERLSPLEIAESSLKGKFDDLKKGDCVVTFSRNNIFAVKSLVEKVTGLRVAVAYGGLPPEVREEQARGFNNSDEPGGYDIMVASDAIGMGLNLKIKRIIFETLHKWDGQQAVELSVSQIKQIAGRAGRYGVHIPSSPSAPDEPGQAESSEVEQVGGIVTCLEEEDMPILRKALAAPMEPIQRAALHPLSSQLEAFSSIVPTSAMQRDVLEIFPVLASVDRDYYMPAFGQALKLSEHLKGIAQLTVAERWLLGYSPVNLRDSEAVRAFTTFATAHANDKVIRITEWVHKERLHQLLEEFRAAEEDVKRVKAARESSSPFLSKDSSDPTSSGLAKQFATSTTLMQFESLHRCLSLYLWLGNRFALHFPQKAEGRLFKMEVEEAIDFILQQMSFKRSRAKERAARVVHTTDGLQDTLVSDGLSSVTARSEALA